jgi:hypothetical protein
LAPQTLTVPSGRTLTLGDGGSIDLAQGNGETIGMLALIDTATFATGASSPQLNTVTQNASDPAADFRVAAVGDVFCFPNSGIHDEAYVHLNNTNPKTVAKFVAGPHGTTFVPSTGTGASTLSPTTTFKDADPE